MVAEIEVEDDARPIARVLAQILRRSAADPELGTVLENLDGVLGLQSSTDPQCATITFRSGQVFVAGGLSGDTDVVITTDLNAPSGPDAPKPTLRELAGLAKAAARRPVFAQNAAKVLEPPLPEWTDAATSFWAVVERRGGGPDALKVICTDDGDELLLGAAVDDPVELHGPARLLSRCFVGDAVLAEELMAGNLRGVAGMGDTSRMIGHGLAVMFGE